MKDLTAEGLVRAARDAAARWPAATLVKNTVGNLSVVDSGDYVGFIDLRTGEVVPVSTTEDQP